MVAFSLYLTVILHWQGPFRDLWEFVPFIEQQFHGQWSLDYLLDPYGGAHRIFFPKLFFFIDFFWLQGRNLLTTSTALLCQCIYLTIIYRIVQEEKNLSTQEAILLTCSFGMALSSTTQINNFLYAMDVQWYMSNALGLASMAILLRPPTATNMTLAMLLGTAAALCNFTGLMALPVAAFTLARSSDYLKPGKKTGWVAGVFIIIVCWLYTHHSKNAQHVVFAALTLSDNWITSVYIVLDTLYKMFLYTLRYLASPLSRDWPVTGSCLSFLSLVVIGAYWMRFWRGKSITALQQIGLYIATYILLSALATAFGRLIYTNSSITERYQTLVLPYMPAVFALVWQDLRNSRFGRVMPAAAVLLLCWHLLPTQLKSAHEMSALGNRVNLAHTAARAGVLEVAYVSSTLSHPLLKNHINAVKDNDTFLREYKLGYFQHLQQFSLDTSVQVAHSLPACEGNAQVTPDIERQTWLVDGKLVFGEQALSDIVLLQRDKVVGLGALSRPEDSLLPLEKQAAEQSRFRAFARMDRMEKNTTTTMVGVSNSIPVCELPLPGFSGTPSR